jgi:hypothetical protein
MKVFDLISFYAPYVPCHILVGSGRVRMGVTTILSQMPTFPAEAYAALLTDAEKMCGGRLDTRKITDGLPQGVHSATLRWLNSLPALGKIPETLWITVAGDLAAPLPVPEAPPPELF